MTNEGDVGLFNSMHSAQLDVIFFPSLKVRTSQAQIRGAIFELRLAYKSHGKFCHWKNMDSSWNQQSTRDISRVQIIRFYGKMATIKTLSKVGTSWFRQPNPIVSRHFSYALSYLNQFPSYCKMVSDAKCRARRSVLIDHCGTKNIDLKTGFNNIERVYCIEKETKRGSTRLSLIEFKSESDADDVARQANHNEGLLPVPLKVFRYIGPSSLHPDEQDLPFPVDQVKLSYKRELTPDVISYTHLVSKNMMSLVAFKMRFITLVNFERILCAGMFEEYELMPFGSSVIDTGNDSGDLDLLLTRKEDHHRVILDMFSDTEDSYLGAPDLGTKPKLVHLDKSLYSETRDKSGIRGTMRWFEYVLREFMPLTDGYGVLLLHNAKVPIIKFTARITNIDCDLSFNINTRERDIFTTNYGGIVMSEILYSLCRDNNLFTAVVIYLRIFGKLTSITSKGTTGLGLTNFQLLSLIMFYLQQISASHQLYDPYNSSEKQLNPIIPSFKQLFDSKFTLKQTINLDDDQLNILVPKIVIGFLKFYSNFDFHHNSLNLYESTIEKKLDNSSIYVLNPIDRTRNICRNVNRKALEGVVKKIRAVLSGLQTSKYENPLMVINTMLSEQSHQARMARVSKDFFHRDDLDNNFGPALTAEEIAEDACR